MSDTGGPLSPDRPEAEKPFRVDAPFEPAGDQPEAIEALVDCGHYDYVLHGHTHEYAHEYHGDTTRINPGGIPIDAAPDAPYAVVLDTERSEIDRHELV